MGWWPTFTSNEWFVVCALGSVNFANTLCASIQAPFYPREAESKGATPAEYGLVFGIYELVAFLSCPIFGKYAGKIGTKILLNGGIATAGIAAILFGCLTLFSSRVWFITLSFLIRILESLGSAAALTASFSITATVFRENVGTMFATMEIFYGVGFIIGPSIGGYLYQLGGFMFPFMFIGVILILIGVLSFFLMPNIDDSNHIEKPPGQILSALRLPSVLLPVYCVIAATVSMGYVDAILEPHLRQFDLTPLAVGGIFVIMGGTYTVTSPILGRICDSGVNPRKLALFGSVLIVISFLLIGPAPFMPFPTILWLVCVGMTLQGLAYSCLLVPSFVDAMGSALAHGLPDDITTYGVVTGLLASAFCLGGFIGPSVAGYLYGTVGFEHGSYFVLATHSILIVLLTWVLCKGRQSTDFSQVYHVPVENIVPDRKENGTELVGVC